MNTLAFLKKMCYNKYGRFCKREEETKMNAISLSSYVISSFEKSGLPITNLKLQKVLYYVQGYFYKHFNKSAFAEDVYNWHYGPVVPIVYYEYNSYGAFPLKPSSNFEPPIVTKEQQKLIEAIINKCSVISTSRLVSMTHSESPWNNSNSGDIISKKSIESFFKYNNPLEIKI